MGVQTDMVLLGRASTCLRRFQQCPEMGHSTCGLVFVDIPICDPFLDVERVEIGRIACMRCAYHRAALPRFERQLATRGGPLLPVLKTFLNMDV